MVKDKAGNSLNRARKWNAIDAKTLVRQDFVGASDRNDLYRFRLSSSGQVNITLSGIQKAANADIELFALKGKPNKILKKIGRAAFEQLSRRDINRYFKRIAISQRNSRKPDSIGQELEAGEYYLRVYQRKGNTRYKLQVAATAAISIEDIFPDNPNEVRSPIFGNDLISGSLIDTDQVNPSRPGHFADDYYLTGITPGQQVTVQLNSGDFDAYLQIVNASSGELIAESNDTKGTLNSEITFKVDRGIDYTVRATSAASNARGNYSLSSTASSPIVGSLAVGGQISGSLTNSDLSNPARINSYSDDYLLTDASAGKQIQIGLNSTEFDTYLQVINTETGEVLGNNDFVDNANSSLAVLNFTVQAGVSYGIRATSFRSDEVGSYTLNAIQVDPSIQTEQTVWGILGKGDEGNALQSETVKDDYTLSNITPGQQLQFNLTSDTFNARLQLLDANTQQVITEQDDIASGNLNTKLIFTTQPNTGYIVRVTSSDARGSGVYQLTSHNLNTDWFSTKLSDSGIQNLARQRAADDVLDRNDVISLFNEASNDGFVNSNELADLRQIEADGDRFNMPEFVRSSAGQVTSAVRSGTSATQFQSSIGAFFLSSSDGPPPPVFNEKVKNQNTGKDELKTYNFDYVTVNGSLFGDTDANPSVGTKGRPQISHIDQGRFGDCAFLAALGATFGRQRQETGQISSVVESMIRTNSDGTFSVRFYSAPNQARWVTVNSRVVTDKSGQKDASLGGTFFGASADAHDTLGSPSDKFQSGRWTNNPDKWPIWVPILERAYAVFRQTVLKQGDNGWDLIGNGDVVQNPLMYVTGRSVTYYRNGLRIGGSRDQPEGLSFNVLQNAVVKGQFITVGTPGDSKKKSGKLAMGKLVTGHAYSVSDVYVSPSGEQRVVVRNPWGKDTETKVMQEKLANGKANPDYKAGSWTGDKWDGFIDLSFSEFATSFTSFAVTDPVPGSFSLTDTIPLPPPINTAPTVSTNQGLFVSSGGVGTIANTQLRTTDSQQASSQITYTITDTPKSGKLLLNGSPLNLGAKLTQAQIDSGQLSYENVFGIKQLASTQTSGGRVSASGLNAVWESSESGQTEIYFYNGSTGATNKLTNNGYNSSPRISNSNVVWHRTAPNEDSEIFLYNGSKIVQLTNNTAYDAYPQISDANVVWSSSNKILLYNGNTGIITQVPGIPPYFGSSEIYISDANLAWKDLYGDIFFYNGATQSRVKLTNDFTSAFGDFSPRISGSNIVWHVYDFVGQSGGIYLYNGQTGTTTQISNELNPSVPHISGSNVVWSASDGNDTEVFFYNGSRVIQLTNNTTNDDEPQISGSNVVWSGFDGNDFEIFFYNGSNTVQLTNNMTPDYVSEISGSSITWVNEKPNPDPYSPPLFDFFFGNFASNDSFNFSVADGAGGTTSGTFNIAIG